MQAKAVILLLALAVAGAHAQSVGNLVGGIVDGALGAAGVDERTFFRPGRCANRRPSAPRNLEARSKNPTTVRLTWRAKDNSCVDFYEITVSTVAS